MIDCCFPGKLTFYRGDLDIIWLVPRPNAVIAMCGVKAAVDEIHARIGAVNAAE